MTTLLSSTLHPRPGKMPHSNCHISLLTLPIEVFFSILESSRQKLRTTYGLIFMTLNPRGLKAFPTPRALIHTRITWAFSPSAPQILGVTLGSPLCPRCFGHSLWRGARQKPLKEDTLWFDCKQMIRPPPNLVGDHLEYEVKGILKCGIRKKKILGEVAEILREKNHLDSGKGHGECQGNSGAL
jgi:hypothetical protein